MLNGPSLASRQSVSDDHQSHRDESSRGIYRSSCLPNSEQEAAAGLVGRMTGATSGGARSLRLWDAPRVNGGRIGTARVGILTIVDSEFDAVREVLGGAAVVTEIGDTAFYSPTPDMEHPDVVFAQTFDRSNGPAQSSCRDMIELFRPETVIVCGIAGGITGRDEVGLGDVVIATYLHYVEFQKLSDEGASPRYFPYDQPTSDVVSGHCKPECRDLDLEGSAPARFPTRRPPGGRRPYVSGR